MNQLLQLLAERIGRYEGEGANHAGEHFTGRLELLRLPEARTVAIRFAAVAPDGKPYHTEESIVADEGEELVLVVESPSMPEGVLEHRFRREEAADGSFRAFVFGYNDVAGRESFRQEIAIEIWENGDIGYRYSWGLPGGEFEPRSTVRMGRVPA